MVIHITRAILIRSRTAKSDARIATLQRNFARYKLPPLEPLYSKAPSYLSYTWLAWRGVFHPKFKDHHSHAQISLALAMYEAFERVARGRDAWAYVFEDDARVVNVPLGGDLVTMRDVPADAEFLAVSRAHSRVYNGSFAPAEPVIGGGLMQALIVSREGARKLVRALKPIWAPNDVILYKAGCAWVPQPVGHQSAYDLERDFGAEKRLPGVKNQRLQPCVRMYFSTRLFDQTSNPTPPCRTDNMTLAEVHARMRARDCGYAVPPEDWVDETTSIVG